MKLLRNADVKRTLLLMLLLGCIGSVLCFIIKPACGIVFICMTIVFIGLYLFDVARRYKLFSELAAELDSIIHDSRLPNLSRYAEGELSILYCELAKLTTRLQEQAELLKSDKLRLADSIADISHQIRTPLTTLNLSLEALRDPEITDAKRNELLLSMHRQLVRMDWLISSLLKMARLDADAVTLKHEEFTLERLILRAAEPLSVLMELKEQRLRIEASGKMTGDLSWTAEALSNVLKNCTEHMNAGEINIIAHENPLYSEITVHDGGVGIAKEDLPHLFERFYRGKASSEESAGIGLALSRMIITRQNGSIKAENHKSGGALFTIRFYKGIV